MFAFKCNPHQVLLKEYAEQCTKNKVFSKCDRITFTEETLDEKSSFFLCSGIHEERTDSVSSVTYMLGNFDFEFTEEAKGTFYQIHNLKSLMNEPECCMNQKI